MKNYQGGLDMDTKVKTSSGAPSVLRWHIERFKSISQFKIVLTIVVLLLVLGGQKGFAQGVGISEVSIVPDPSSILDLQSIQRGFLTPRMSEVQRDAIGVPATGLIIYNTTTNKLNIYDGAVWRVLFSGNIGINDIFGTADRITIDKTDVANPIINIANNYAGQASITTLGTITTGTWNASTVDVQYGGTGLSSITANNLLYGNGIGPVSLLAPSGTSGTVLMNTAAGAPSWSLLTDLPSTAGVLPIANGGTNSGTALAGSSIMISDGTSILQGDAGTSTTVLHGNATGVPTYGQVVSSDIQNETILSEDITDGTIVNVDVNAGAAIAGTKIDPDFGAQNVITTGTLAAGATTVTGNIAVTGTVDGRDVATDGTNQDALQTLSGVVAGDPDLGTFTGTTISDDVTVKAALQELEIATETGLAQDLNDAYLNGNTITTDATGNVIIAGTQALEVTATGGIIANTADINAGTIDNTVIGGATAAAGTFTTVNAGTSVTTADLTATGTVDLGTDEIESVEITDGTIVNVDVNAGAAIA
ncbi:MAG: hypothetical protein JEY96_14140, partial [Bacteroidales bacterium]|nr:hypothetical protein [Bacteroidales bacterium]